MKNISENATNQSCIADQGTKVDIITSTNPEDVRMTSKGYHALLVTTRVAELLWTSQVDESVQLMLVDRALVVTYLDCYTIPAVFDDGSVKFLQRTIAIGIVRQTGGENIIPNLWAGQYYYDKLLHIFRNEIMAWWDSVTPARKKALMASIDDNPRIEW